MMQPTTWSEQGDGTKVVDCAGCPAHCCKVLPAMHPSLGLPLNKDTGYCAHLVGDRCSIYAERPDFCRTHKPSDALMDLTVAYCDMLKGIRTSPE